MAPSPTTSNVSPVTLYPLFLLYNRGTNWCKELYDIFSQIDMQHVFHNKTVCNLDLCKEKLAQFKKELGIEKYVLNIRSKNERSMVAKLRCGILQLHVESGRFNQTILENRICNVCNNNIIEDKFLFVYVQNVPIQEPSYILNIMIWGQKYKFYQHF